MKKLKFVIVLLLSVVLFINVSAQDNNRPVISEKTKELIKNGAKYGEDSLMCVQQFSLYREYYKQWNASSYENEAVVDAISAWRWCFINGPKASQNIYIDGVKIIDYLYNNTEDAELKKSYIDTILMIYDQRILAYGHREDYSKGYILGRRGVEIMKYRKDDFEEAFHNFTESVKIEGNKSSSTIIYYYYLTTTKMVKASKADTVIIFENYDIISRISAYNIKNNEKEVASYKKAQENIDNLFSPWASCEQIVKIYKPKFKENGHDIDLLKRITKALDKNGCTDAQLYFDASDSLYAFEPSPESAFVLGKMYLGQKIYDKAITYLNLAVDSIGDTEKKATIYLLLADAYRSVNNYSTARDMAYKCLKLNPNKGMAYIIIGDMYASNSKSCGDNELTEKAGYWAAADKYYKAKSVDPSVEKTANSRIGTCTANYPTNSDIFFHGYTKGQSYTVGCWIQETTTIKSSD